MTATASSVLALDVGAKRIGVAAASLIARLPSPVTTLDAQADDLWQQLQTLINDHDAGALVIGLPRGLNGQETTQTESAEAFAAAARQRLAVPVHLQDEAVTSRQAEAELERRGKPYTRADIDALAATYILEDWLTEHAEQAI